MANYIGVSSQTLSSWESGSQVPNGYNVELITKWLDTNAVFHMEPTVIHGGLIKRRREAMGLSRDELASLMGVSDTSISLWEAGKRSPSRRHKEWLVEWLGDENSCKERQHVSNRSLADESSDMDEICDIPVSEISSSVRAKRRDWGMTREALGEYLGVHPVTIGNWERGEARPSYTNFKLICEWLDADMTELIFRNSPNDNQTEA